MGILASHITIILIIAHLSTDNQHRPDDFARPNLLRKTLQSGPQKYSRATETPLPSGCEAMKCNMSMVPNWAFSFYQELAIEGCTQVSLTLNLKTLKFSILLASHVICNSALDSSDLLLSYLITSLPYNHHNTSI